MQQERPHRQKGLHVCCQKQLFNGCTNHTLIRSIIGLHPFTVFRRLKLNSYLNASIFLLLCRMHFSIFGGQERLTDRLISKRYLKSDIAT